MTFTGAVHAGKLTAKDIIARMDANAYMVSAHFAAKLVIKTGGREIAKEIEGWVVCQEKSTTLIIDELFSVQNLTR